MISFEKVTKYFGDVTAIDSVSFEIKDNEFVYLTGPSGCGKTTILKLILREIVADSGTVVVDNVDLSVLSNKELVLFRQKIGVVFQDFKVLSENTVYENIELALAVTGVKENEWEKRITEVLKIVNLSKKSDKFPLQLSGGELQRVAIARALVVNPRILIADEPTGNLDWKTSEEVITLLEDIQKTGRTVIMATHNEHIIKNHKHRVIDVVELEKKK